MEHLLPEAMQLFSREGLFSRWLTVEAALARAQARLQVIPEQVARDIEDNARVEKLDLARYDELYEKTGHPMVAMLKLLEAAAGPSSGQFIHLGATTQDVMDTALMLALQKTADILQKKLQSILLSTAGLCERYADTPMMGRTHNIHALPITFGYKTAVWADEVMRAQDRLEQSRSRVLALQMSGAVGSMVSFDGQGDATQRLIADELGLAVPDICWHASRDRLAEFTGQLALLAGLFSRIAQEVYLLMGSEIAELSEPWTSGTIGSSAMPHKINPTTSQHMMSLARDIRYHHSAVLEMMTVDHERNIMHFIGERQHVEAACIAAAELLDRADDLLASLVVHEKNMLLNIDKLGGLTQSEHVMRELGKAIGKQRAHELVGEIAVHAYQEHLNFADLLKHHDGVTQHILAEKIDQLLDPLPTIGDCQALALRIAEKARIRIAGGNAADNEPARQK
jgi:adenylosuccinate lyase